MEGDRLLASGKGDGAARGGQGRVDEFGRLQARAQVELVGQADRALHVAGAGQVDGVGRDGALSPFELGGAGGLNARDGDACGNDQTHRGVGDGGAAQSDQTVNRRVSAGGIGFGKVNQFVVDIAALDHALHANDVGQQANRLFAAINDAVRVADLRWRYGGCGGIGQ